MAGEALGHAFEGPALVVAEVGRVVADHAEQAAVASGPERGHGHGHRLQEAVEGHGADEGPP